MNIYIPLWLDLLCKSKLSTNNCLSDLHSTMVRFIIITRRGLRRIWKLIYIPLWLDLLFELFNIT